MVVVLVGLF